MGDLRAQITALKTGERRFLELIERYGRDAVLDSIAAIMDQSERAARARTQAIPDGVYEAQSFMDDDGLDPERSIPIKVKVDRVRRRDDHRSDRRRRAGSRLL